MKRLLHEDFFKSLHAKKGLPYPAAIKYLDQARTAGRITGIYPVEVDQKAPWWCQLCQREFSLVGKAPQMPHRCRAERLKWSEMRKAVSESGNGLQVEKKVWGASGTPREWFVSRYV